MDYDLDNRRARLSVGELADFGLGPRDSSDGPSGLWRAELGMHWHAELRDRASSSHPATEFEVRVEGTLSRQGWSIDLEGRIDQLVRSPEGIVLREIKTVTRGLPEEEAVLRREYPSYFAQLAIYAELARLRSRNASYGGASTAPTSPVCAELVFVEVSGGLIQTVPLGAGDHGLCPDRLESLAVFLDAQAQGRRRRRSLSFNPPFPSLRPGQETAQARLSAALASANRPILFEAPTGFGKTGVMLGSALEALRSGHFDRAVYLTGKATGQIQVSRTLQGMLGSEAAAGLFTWTVRPKSEHCVNQTYLCVREACRFLDGVGDRWLQSGLQRIYLYPGQPRDLESLRAAGKAAGVCPYEITRAALPFSDFWIGDYNYVFAPANRGLFYQQPGFQPGRTLLLVDEAHNLPSRVAAAFSHEFSGAGAEAVRLALARMGAASDLDLAWEAWSTFLNGLDAGSALPPEQEEETHRHLERLAELLRARPLDYANLGAEAAESLWQVPSVAGQLQDSPLPRVMWCPRPGQLTLTCLDAAGAIQPILAEFGGVVLATATPGPIEVFAEALGVAEARAGRPGPPVRLGGVGGPALPSNLGDLTKRETRRLARAVTNGARLLQLEEAKAEALCRVPADVPWRAGAYDIACDVRVDTRFRSRARHYSTTADTVAMLCRAATSLPLRGRDGSPSRPSAAVFFSSYAYADAVAKEVAERHPGLRIALQPRASGLAAQAAWVEQSLAEADALFLILGSSYAESIDQLGGRVDRAMVVGPALPEVNPVQQARQAALAGLGSEPAFHRVYRIPGMQKVNQALGRLIRAPGQRARVLLHCRRFAEPEYAALLALDHGRPQRLETDADLAAWLG